MLESLLTAITDLSLSAYVSKSFAHLWIVQYLPIIIFKILQALSNWLLVMARQPFSGLAIDFQVDLSDNCYTATQEHSLTSCVLGYCPAEM